MPALRAHLATFPPRSPPRWVRRVLLALALAGAAAGGFLATSRLPSHPPSASAAEVVP